MKNRKRKIQRVVVFLLAILCIVNTMAPTVAAEQAKVYVTKATSYYKHPVTGEVEDIGKNEGLGQPMTESVLHPKALLEVDSSGKLYATVRFFLTDHISEVSFSTQKRGETSFKKVSYEITQENIGGTYCSDYRIQIPSEDAIVRAQIYITAMGREVIFYCDFSNKKAGKGDFIATVGTENIKQQEIVVTKVTEEPQVVEASEEQGEQGEQGEEVAEPTEAPTIEPTEVPIIESTEDINKENVEVQKIIPSSLSWMLVLQSIIIITVPSISILIFYFLICLFLQRKEK